MSALEISAALFGVVYVLLAIKGNAWCWPAGIISAALYIVFDIELKYFLDAILQCYYVLAGFYGWYLWTQSRERDAMKSDNTITSFPLQKLFPFLLLGTVLTPALGYVFAKAGNAYPYLDAATAVFSFIATYLTAKKVLENWLMWVFIDLVLIAQYAIKQAYITSGFYAFLAAMAVLGYLEWKKQLRTAASS
jgi:nicotinamide mononucleotide transporter